MKNKILKILLILSFIPYLYIIYLIFAGKINLNGVELKGGERILENIKNYIPMYTSFIPVIPACLTYQMCFLFRNNTKKLLICSFIPYMFMILVGILYAIFGINVIWDNVSYGFEAFELAIIFQIAVGIMKYPVIPIYIIFQIYVIMRMAKEKKNDKGNGKID